MFISIFELALAFITSVLKFPILFGCNFDFEELMIVLQEDQNPNRPVIMAALIMALKPVEV